MSKYILLCKQPVKPKISLSNYLFDEKALNSYSLSDLCGLQQLFKSLSEAHNVFMSHIINECEVRYLLNCLIFFVINIKFV